MQCIMLLPLEWSWGWLDFFYLDLSRDIKGEGNLKYFVIFFRYNRIYSQINKHTKYFVKILEKQIKLKIGTQSNTLCSGCSQNPKERVLVFFLNVIK